MRGVSAPDDDRRSRLLGAQLRGLVGEHLGTELGADSVGGFPGGAALLTDDHAWVLIEGDASRALGGALAWALRRGARRLGVVAAEGAGQVARRAAHFDVPIAVWRAVGRQLEPVAAAPLPIAPDAPDEHLGVMPLIEAGGAEPRIEFGVVTGEVRGLEVCRVVDEPTRGTLAELDAGVFEPLAGAGGSPDGVMLEVGVGAADREAFQILHGDLPTVDALRTVVDQVLRFRSPDAPHHPLNRLVPERALRWELCSEPSRIGAAELTAAAPPVPRTALRELHPCVAAGTDVDGRSVLVVCSVGIDLDLAAFVGDAVAAHEAAGVGADRVIVATPARDMVDVTAELLAALRFDVEHLAPAASSGQ